jgi:hypothetical protein
MAHSEQNSSQSRSRAFGLGLGTLVLALAWSILHRNSFGPYHAAFYEDDFFYYVQIARNIVTLGKSTFDGTTLTNGYHPLWLWMLTVVWWASAPSHFFLVVDCIIAVCALSTYCAAFHLANQARLRPLGCLLISFWTTGTYLTIAVSGMEVILTVPLSLALLGYVLSPRFEWKPKQSLCFGLLGGIVSLSRLDAALLVAWLVMFHLAASWTTYKDCLRRLTFLLIGTVPFGFYLCTNLVLFGQIMPISGTAKHLKTSFGFSSRPLAIMLLDIRMHLNQLSTILLIAICIVPLGIVFLLLQRRQTISRQWFAGMLAALTFPCLFLAVLSFASDWPIWDWYFYPFVISSLFGGIAILLKLQDLSLSSRMRFILPTSEILALAYVVVLFGGALTLVNPLRQGLYLAALRIAQFSDSHPGHYAMGDRSAIVGYKLKYPLLQLEGLVMDRRYIDLLRTRTDLLQVLQEYGIKYYVTTNPIQNGECFHFLEPRLAGPDSPKLSMVLCAEPLLTYIAPDGNRSYVFEIPRR